MENETYEAGFKKGYSTGFWAGAIASFFCTVGLLLLIGAYVPLP